MKMRTQGLHFLKYNYFLLKAVIFFKFMNIIVLKRGKILIILMNF